MSNEPTILTAPPAQPETPTATPAPEATAPRISLDGEFLSLVANSHPDMTAREISTLQRLWRGDGKPKDLTPWMTENLPLVRGAQGNAPASGQLQYVPRPAEPAMPGRSNTGAPGTSPNLGMPSDPLAFKTGQFRSLPREQRDKWWDDFMGTSGQTNPCVPPGSVEADRVRKYERGR